MITGIYGGILAIACIFMALRVIKLRGVHRVSLGDGGVEELQRAIAAHNNAVQYIPIALILSYILENQQLNIYLIHIAGIALILGRLLHAISMINPQFKGRVLGMQLTVGVIISLALLAIIWPIYRLIIG